jgi:hypothetical protein
MPTFKCAEFGIHNEIKHSKTNCQEKIWYQETYIHNLLTLGSWALLERPPVCSHSIVSQSFMENEGLLPHSQELFTCPYPEPDQTNQSTPLYPTSPRSILILSINLCLCFPSGLFLSGFHANADLETWEYGSRDPSRWPHGTLYPQKLALTSPTSGSRSVGIVLSRTQAMEIFPPPMTYTFFFSPIRAKCPPISSSSNRSL